MPTHREKIDALVRQLRTESGGAVRLAKDTSNLFRDRTQQQARKIDVRGFNQVLDIDSVAGNAEISIGNPNDYGSVEASVKAGDLNVGAFAGARTSDSFGLLQRATWSGVRISGGRRSDLSPCLYRQPSSSLSAVWLR